MKNTHRKEVDQLIAELEEITAWQLLEKATKLKLTTGEIERLLAKKMKLSKSRK